MLSSVITSVSYPTVQPNRNDKELQQCVLGTPFNRVFAGEKRSPRSMILLC